MAIKRRRSWCPACARAISREADRADLPCPHCKGPVMLRAPSSGSGGKPGRSGRKRDPERDAKIAALKRGGLTHAAIAEELGCAPNTVVAALRRASS